MAPIHHHFVMEAWSETKIMLRFWIVAAACGAVGFTLYQISGTPAVGSRTSRVAHIARTHASTGRQRAAQRRTGIRGGFRHSA